MGYLFTEEQKNPVVEALDYIDLIRAELYVRNTFGRNNAPVLEKLSWNELCDRGIELFEELKKEDVPPKKIYPRCDKCIRWRGCARDMDNDNSCPRYKRDAPDGGYYG